MAGGGRWRQLAIIDEAHLNMSLVWLTSAPAGVSKIMGRTNAQATGWVMIQERPYRKREQPSSVA